MSKVLVAYFSASGVTKKVAEELARAARLPISGTMPGAATGLSTTGIIPAALISW